MKVRQDPGLSGPQISYPSPTLAVITSGCSIHVQGSVQTKSVSFLVKI